jgi:hypothetical protein
MLHTAGTNDFSYCTHLAGEDSGVGLMMYGIEIQFKIQWQRCMAKYFHILFVRSCCRSTDFRCGSEFNYIAVCRVVIAYANGLIVLWGLHETQVLAVRGGTAVQRKQLAEYSTKLERTRSIAERVMEQAVTLGEQFTSSSSSKSSTLEEEDEEEKEICTICWACSRGTVLAAGYVDGEIWLWSIPPVSKERDQGEQNDPRPPTSSGIPLRKLDLAPGKAMKMPVILLSWCGSSKTCKRGSGRLHVYGGHDLGSPQSLMVDFSFTLHYFLSNVINCKNVLVCVLV